MGKKSKLKAIRRLAVVMPEVQEIRKVGKTLMGHEILDNPKKYNVPVDSNGKFIDPKREYKLIEPKIVHVNHARRMKQIYNKFGSAGIKAYVTSLQDQHLENIAGSVEADLSGAPTEAEGIE